MHILITERDETYVSGLAETLHLLQWIDIVEHVLRGRIKLPGILYVFTYGIDRSVNLNPDFTLVYPGFL